MKIMVLVVLLVLMWLGLRSLEPRTLYYPERDMAATPSVYRLVYEDLSLKASDGTKIHAWFVPSRPSKIQNPKSKMGLTLLFCHGNAGNISHRLDKLRLFHDLGLNVLLFDYRGYGKSEGKPTEQGTYQDAEAAYRYLVETQKIPQGKIIFYGESLGSAVALEMAVRHPSAALILESAFTSTLAMGKLVYPWLPVRWLVRYRYDNLAKIPRLKAPLLILHSPQDEIVPFWMAQALFAAAPGPKKLFELTGGHNDGFEVTGKAYVDAIRKFVLSLDESPSPMRSVGEGGRHTSGDRVRAQFSPHPSLLPPEGREKGPSRAIQTSGEASPERLEEHVRTLSEKMIPRDGDHIQNLDRAADYIRGHLEESGGRLTEQSYTIKEWNQRNQQVAKGPYRNVIASFGPEAGERLIIGAHYDADGPYPGADDNASGVAALLELARLLKERPPSLRTDLVAYTLEEPPYFGQEEMGSAVHAASLAKEGVRVRLMVSLEMLGYFSDEPGSQKYPVPIMKALYPSRGNYLALIGRVGSLGRCWALKKRMREASPLPVRILTAPSFLPGVDFSDHRNFWRHGYPAVMLTDTSSYRNPHYHTPQDTADKLDYERMAQAAQGVLAIIQGEL